MTTPGTVDEELDYPNAHQSPRVNPPTAPPQLHVYPKRTSTSPEAAMDEKRIEQEQQQQQQQQQQHLDHPSQQHQTQPFQPLFTLITDSSGATHHPHVHYIFEDDDPDQLTHILGTYSTHHQQSGAASSGSKPTPPTDRAIILDLVPKPASTAPDAAPNPSGYEVAWASSLSADWAVISANLAPMNSGDDASSTHNAPAQPATSSSSERLMLRIEGVDLDPRPPAQQAARELPSTNSNSSSAVAQLKEPEDYSALVVDFDARMAVLRKVVAAGAERQAKMAAGGSSGGVAQRGEEPPVAGVFEHNLPSRGSGHRSSSPPAVVEQQLYHDRGITQSGLGTSSNKAFDSSGVDASAQQQQQPVVSVQTKPETGGSVGSDGIGQQQPGP
ncbi:unnamed protein product [Discula destructiva]